MPQNLTALDQLMTKEGTEFKENLYKFLTEQEVNNKLKNKLSYDDNCPIPGQSIDDKLDEQINSINEDTALENLIQKSAMIKAKNEAANGVHILTAEEKKKRREDFIEAMLYQQGEAYFEKYHYMMDGKTKRRTRKMIERNYDKGRYKKYMTGTLALN